MDARWFQIFALLSLFVFQQIGSDFSHSILLVLGFIFFIMSLQQYLFKGTNSKSAVITGISLSLLLRTSHPIFLLCSGILALLSKRFLKFQNKHIFNPANIAIIFLITLFPGEFWSASGVWGKYWLAVLAFSLYGSFLTKRVQRLDISLSFLIFYLGLHAVRLLWLDDPMNLLLFRLNSLALIVFSFFMISDPKTTPNSSLGRVLFALIVAIIAYVIDTVLFRRNGLFYALAIASPLVILINKVFSGERFQWKSIDSTTN